jgi:hypothetical protein
MKKLIAILLIILGLICFFYGRHIKHHKAKTQHVYCPTWTEKQRQHIDAEDAKAKAAGWKKWRSFADPNKPFIRFK